MDFRITDISSMSDESVVVWGAMPTRGGPSPKKKGAKKTKGDKKRKKRKTKKAVKRRKAKK